VAAAPKKPGRDRYLDLLRSLALVRVVTFHIFGWPWLTILFPSMGVMFALAGSLMARSLDSRPAGKVIRSRLRRLLPPMWLFSVILLALLFYSGWNPAKDPNVGGGWNLLTLLEYIVPVGAPPYPDTIGPAGSLWGNTWGADGAEVLWYLRAYLWFVVTSPLLLWAFRRAPWATLLAPLALTAVFGTGLVTVPGEAGNALTDFVVYAGCWILGMAHHEGTLKQVPRYVVVSLSAFLMAFALWWASGHADGGMGSWDFDQIRLSSATWSLGFCAILLQYSPSWQQFPGRLRRFDKLITLSNNRAVTIYLWHNLFITATFPMVDQAYNLPFMQSEGASDFLTTVYMWVAWLLIWPLVAMAILAFGWAEDVAAKRRPRLWPDGAKRGKGRAAPAAGAPSGGRRRSGDGRSRHRA
jgi:peptidoglycan/LPS O-acetylase OafA/YrhL